MTTRDVPAPRSARAARALAGLLLAGALLAGCSGGGGSDGKKGDPGDPGEPAPTDDVLLPSEDAPGVNAEILALDGGSGDSDHFEVGDTLTVTFRLTKDDGSVWGLSELEQLRALLAGPSYNYQLILPQATDLLTASEFLGDGTYRYTFASPIPDVFPAPYNDTDSFGAGDGELQGEPLPGGTYTLSLYGYWGYSVGGESFRDVVNAEQDFLLGSSGALAPREVVTDANCNQCHVALQAHGGQRRDVTLCLACHGSGAEDRNTASVAGGTPGVSIDFRVMIHKLHNAEHLPSVLGVATHPDGSRDYDATPAPYQMIGFGDSLIDFSEVAFPVWPSLTNAMPRDFGYSALTTSQKAQEDEIRRGVVACDKCHGDPDGDGELPAPAQGGLAYSQPTRRACGACHDDIDWEAPYVANTEAGMPAQADDSSCTTCHAASGDSLAVMDAHLHPMTDPALALGIHFDVSALAEAGAHDGDGTFDPGEKLAMTFTVTDDAGAELATSSIASMTALVTGPSQNPQVLLNQGVVTGMLTGAQPFTINVPEVVLLEYVGESTGALGDVFVTARTPHWNVTGATTTVLSVTAVGGAGKGNSTLADDAVVTQNWVDVASATDFAHDDYVVIADGTGSEEYLRVQGVEGNRLFFGSLASTSYARALRFDHPAGTTITEVTTESQGSGNWTLDKPTGTLTETVEFGDGEAVLVTYTSDFVVPDVYPPVINDSPDMGEDWGEWTGKSLVAGTYVLNFYGYRNIVVALEGESQTYRDVEDEGQTEFLVGDATEIEPHQLISSPQNCYACHDDVYLHGSGRRGFSTCIGCHSAPGEDRPPYVAGNAPETALTSIDFRTMLHKIHMGAELTDPSAYEVVGFGSTAWPDNYGVNTYEAVEFPAMPGLTMHCSACHGEDNDAWKDPGDRNHPTEQGHAAQVWRAACASCHDSDDAAAHIELQTTSAGAESCGVCHGEGKELSVELAHKTR